MKKTFLLLTLIAVGAAAITTAQQSTSKTAHTVVDILEVKPEHANAMETELLKIKGLSKNESYCQEYRVCRDNNNQNTFILYEVWDSAEDHKKQFTKDYILDFIKFIDGKLAKPYEFFFATEVK